MAKTLGVKEFFEMFPDDDVCLEHLMLTRHGKTLDCPKCGRNGAFNRLKKEPAYACSWCGHHIHPMKGTPFEASHTPLQKWFYAIYLFTTTRHGVPAKELQRQLSVTYKTAWRMGHEIRKYMAIVDGDEPLSGTVEVDETMVGGKQRGVGPGFKVTGNKAIVFGMVERDGKLMTKVVRDSKKRTLLPLIGKNIERGTMVYSDEHPTYRPLPLQGYPHLSVNHRSKEYVRGVVHTNSIENVWAALKRSIRGTHIHVSPKYLQNYLGEFEFRFNLRKSPHLMFQRLLRAF